MHYMLTTTPNDPPNVGVGFIAHIEAESALAALAIYEERQTNGVLFYEAWGVEGEDKAFGTLTAKDPNPICAIPATVMTLVFNITGFTPHEAEVLSGEIQAQCESSAEHGEALFVTGRTDGPPLVEVPKRTVAMSVKLTGDAEEMSQADAIKSVAERLATLELDGLEVDVDLAWEEVTP